ncbi:hypothetical protein FHT44_005111 [Mycolicibacterium sp. BK634]|uniref:hypothetical protein n=1 Tax=Mycolicibacterium sp. BK634 TaxID=2587099 RepID=UPI00160BBAB9|nr:hypothetical protein [Mycolicibacterium sp. BK634]MBB3752599.1 hypothetical protein [Mycolicibacterium sp. BK634]
MTERLKTIRSWLIGLTPSIDLRSVQGVLATIVELLGFAAIVYGCFLIAPFVGAIVAGIALLILARAIDPPSAPPTPYANKEDGWP